VTRIPGTYRRNRRALFLLPSIPDDAPEALKNAIGLRNQCAVEGRCPACGALPEPWRDEHGLDHLTFRHDEDCPVVRDDLTYGRTA
jgi:hypothetical protein